MKLKLKTLLAVFLTVGLVGCTGTDFDNFRIPKGKIYIVEQTRFVDKCNEVKLMDSNTKSYVQVKVYFTDCQNKFKPGNKIKLVPTLIAD